MDPNFQHATALALPFLDSVYIVCFICHSMVIVVVVSYYCSHFVTFNYLASSQFIRSCVYDFLDAPVSSTRAHSTTYDTLEGRRIKMVLWINSLDLSPVPKLLKISMEEER